MKVCLVTEELAGVQGSGGIGAAFFELALLLAGQDYTVDVLYCPAMPFSKNEEQALRTSLLAKGIALRVLDVDTYVDGVATYERKAYATYENLRQHSYDVIHFHDYKGLGFCCFNAKHQGLDFANTQLVLQMHGPTRWALEANNLFFTHEDQLKIDFMERECTRKADLIVSPSNYLFDWLVKADFVAEKESPRHRVIKNVCSNLARQYPPSRTVDSSSFQPIGEVIFFGRHEDRKGIVHFCNAIQAVHDDLAARGVKVTFLGKFGKVNGHDSGVFLLDRCKGWKLDISVQTSLDRDAVAAYLRRAKDALVVVASPYENSPYTVVETILHGKPLICSNEGGGPELVGGANKDWSLVKMDRVSLAARIREALISGAPASVFDETPSEIDQRWLDLHREIGEQTRAATAKQAPKRLPKVVFGITHFERYAKLMDAINSAIRQSYPNLEIVVIDDGSTRPDTVEGLKLAEQVLDRVGGRLIRQQNRYLGAARNTIINNTSSDYLIFLDDDDVALPELVETLVTSIETSGADAVNCLNLYFDEKQRGYGVSYPEKHRGRVSYVPLGGPLSIAPLENTLGSATAIFRRSALTQIGGYTEIYGVGHEDYELFLKLLQAGLRLEICPRPLYLYEVGRIGMLLNTSLQANFKRCFDALDFKLNPDAWHDHVSLSIGKNTAVNEHNRLYWLNSSMPNGQLRTNLLVNKYDSPYHKVMELIELARAQGSSNMVKTFMDEAARINSSAPISEESMEFFTLSSARSATQIPAARNDYDPAFMSIRYDIALRRYDSALLKLLAYLSEKFAVETMDIALMSDILALSAGKISKDVLIRVREYLSTAKISCNSEQASFELMTTLLALSEDRTRLLELIGIANELDEREYLTNYPDIRDAVRDGAFANGLTHFDAHGHSEGWRNGYKRLQYIANAIKTTRGKQVPLRQLVDFANDLRS